MMLVPSIDDMDDGTFLKHMDDGHVVANGPLATHPGRSQGWIGPYRALHERAHNTTPSEHEHERVRDFRR